MIKIDGAIREHTIELPYSHFIVTVQDGLTTAQDHAMRQIADDHERGTYALTCFIKSWNIRGIDAETGEEVPAPICGEVVDQLHRSDGNFLNNFLLAITSRAHTAEEKATQEKALDRLRELSAEYEKQIQVEEAKAADDDTSVTTSDVEPLKTDTDYIG